VLVAHGGSLSSGLLLGLVVAAIVPPILAYMLIESER
jgi:hypothetical protein